MKKVILLVVIIGALIYLNSYIKTGKLQKLIDENPDYTWAEKTEYLLIKYHYYRGKKIQAVWEMDHFIELFPDSSSMPDVLDMKANLFLDANDKRGLAVFQELLAKYKGDRRFNDWQKKYEIFSQQ